MSDHHDAPDSMDEAYRQAEALLSDDAGRAARRAKMLAAVAGEPTALPATASSWRPTRRSGGWLAAAGVVGLSVFVASQVYRPTPRPRPTATAAKAAPAAMAPSAAATAPASGLTPPPQAPRAAPRAEIQAPAPSRRDETLAPPPPPQFDKPADRAASAPLAAEAAPAPPAPAPAALAARQTESKAYAYPPSDPAAKLRAAAAAGQTAEVQALLAQGVPVDAADADGDTALMKSIQADHPAAAALLRRHGASLDRTNHAGRSARDLAAATGDAELNEAVGLPPNR